LGVSSSSNQDSSGKYSDELIPVEENGDPTVLGSDPNKLKKRAVSRGQFRVSFRVAAEGDFDPARLRDETKEIPVDNEFKRVHIYKADLVPTGETTGEGLKLYQVTAVVRVLDNPLPLVPLAWALVAAIGAGGSWVVIDKLESFTQTSIGSLLTIAASIAGILGGIYLVFGDNL